METTPSLSTERGDLSAAVFLPPSPLQKYMLVLEEVQKSLAKVIKYMK